MSARDRRVGGQSGFSLVEMLVALALAGLILALVAPLIMASSDSEATTAAMTDTDNGIRPALLALADQITATSVLYAPSSPTALTDTSVPAGFALLLYSGPPGQQTCIQWRLADNLFLQERSWNPASPSSFVPWKTVDVGVVNATSTPPFTLAGTTAPEDTVVELDFEARARPGDPTLDITAADSALNIATSTTTDPCATVPPTSSTGASGT